MSGCAEFTNASAPKYALQFFMPLRNRVHFVEAIGHLYSEFLGGIKSLMSLNCCHILFSEKTLNTCSVFSYGSSIISLKVGSFANQGNQFPLGYKESTEACD
jgi:hypothetical protein